MICVAFFFSKFCQNSTILKTQLLISMTPNDLPLHLTILYSYLTILVTFLVTPRAESPPWYSWYYVCLADMRSWVGTRLMRYIFSGKYPGA